MTSAPSASEDRIQASIVQFIRTVAPDCRVFSVPNGAFLAGQTEQQRKRQASKLIWTGLLPGVFDLVLLTPNADVAFIEVKTKTGRLEDTQEEFRDYLVARGFRHCIARGIEDVREAFLIWRIPTREHVEARA